MNEAILASRKRESKYQKSLTQLGGLPQWLINCRPRRSRRQIFRSQKKVERVGLSLGRFSHNSWSRRAIGLAFIFILLRLLFFAFWCVLVSHGYSLPQVAKLS